VTGVSCIGGTHERASCSSRCLDRPALGAQIHSPDREQIEGRIGGWHLSAPVASFRRAGHETLLEGIEAQATIRAEDDELAVQYDAIGQ
jgi:hypothetical protein